MSTCVKNSCLHSKELLRVEHDSDNNPLFLDKNSTTKKLDGKLKTFQPKRSSVLSEVQAFLPQLAHANDQMFHDLKSEPKKYDIEAEDESYEGPVIEMNMALVLQNDAKSSSEEDSSDSESEHCFGEVTEENFKIWKTVPQKKCLIQEMTGKDSEEKDSCAEAKT